MSAKLHDYGAIFNAIKAGDREYFYSKGVVARPAVAMLSKSSTAHAVAGRSTPCDSQSAKRMSSPPSCSSFNPMALPSPPSPDLKRSSLKDFHTMVFGILRDSQEKCGPLPEKYRSQRRNTVAATGAQDAKTAADARSTKRRCVGNSSRFEESIPSGRRRSGSAATTPVASATDDLSPRRGRCATLAASARRRLSEDSSSDLWALCDAIEDLDITARRQLPSPTAFDEGVFFNDADEDEFAVKADGSSTMKRRRRSS